MIKANMTDDSPHDSDEYILTIIWEKFNTEKLRHVFAV